MKTDEILKQLTPDEGVVQSYKDMETLSIVRINELLKAPHEDEDGSKLEIAKLSDRILKTVMNFRASMRSEMNLHIKLFRDISDNKSELTAYIKATYPKMIDKK